MWENLNQAQIALERDGWKRYTAYNYHKTVSGRKIWLELEWEEGRRRFLIPVINDESED